ncbi:MAG TPA: NAD(P)H-binding protein [Bryobacteraceae bacterium]|nr:NAD(P)H-binding protein [Bryobacteraceae bacterium]
MSHPILVTGAAGRTGGIGRKVVELLLRQGKNVRAMVRIEDDRAQALRDMGAEVVIGDLLDLDSLHRAVAGCEAMYFGMSISESYLEAAVNTAAVAKQHRVKAFVNMSQMTLAQMSIRESTASPQHKQHWLAEEALKWSGLPVIHVRPTVLLEGFFLPLTASSVRSWNQILLPFGDGKTSPVGVDDVARVTTVLLMSPQPHIGKIYHLTGPQSEDMSFFAQEYSMALGREITYRDVPVGEWRDGLLARQLPIHLVNHLAAMADLHRAGQYHRMSSDVLTVTGRSPGTLREFVKNNAVAFTAQSQTARVSDAARTRVV